MTESEWHDWFAFHVKIDGIHYWLQWVQRRRVTQPENMGIGARAMEAAWQYRLRPDDPSYSIPSTN